MIIRKYLNRLSILMMIFLFVSCGSREGKEYVGKWQSEKLGSGNSVILEIEEDGELYKIHKYTIDEDGKLVEGKYVENKTFIVPVENGVLQINPLVKISYSENDGKLYTGKLVLSKME